MPEAPKPKAAARSGKKSEYKDKDKPSQIRQSNITAAKCKCLYHIFLMILSSLYC